MKKKDGLYSFRNDKKNIFAILGDNKKFLMPILFAVAVVITVVVALSANRRAQEMAQTSEEASKESTYEVQYIRMEKNAYPEVNKLVETYYEASAKGDLDTISSIYRGLEDTELLKVVAASEYIEDYQNIVVYTKPGPVDDSYVVYVEMDVKLNDYDTSIPGLETLYICTDEDGQLYINGDIADSSIIDYLRLVNVQEDVIDLNNTVADRYNKMVQSDEELAELLTKMRSDMQVSVGEALASSEAATNAASEGTGESAADQEETSSDGQTVTTHTIRATDVINIRSSDSETADIIDKTSKGQEYKQLEALANGWSKIEYKGGVAYVKTEFFEVVGEETVEVTDAQTQEAEQETAQETTTETSKETTDNNASTTTVKASETGKMSVKETVRLRKSQSTDSDVLDIIYQGSTVNVVEQYESGWAKVEYSKKTGYIKSEYLTK